LKYDDLSNIILVRRDDHGIYKRHVGRPDPKDKSKNCRSLYGNRYALLGLTRIYYGVCGTGCSGSWR